MAFPPNGFQKPNAKQWAGGTPMPPRKGPPPPLGAAPPGARPPVPGQDPNANPADQKAPPLPVGPTGTDGQPPRPGAPGSADSKMMVRAHKAIGQLLMEGGLPKEVEDMLMQVNHKLVETRPGPPGQDPNANPADGEQDGTEVDQQPVEGGASGMPPKAGAVPPKAPPFPPKAAKQPAGPGVPPFAKA